MRRPWQMLFVGITLMTITAGLALTGAPVGQPKLSGTLNLLYTPKNQIVMAHPASSGAAYTALITILQLKGGDNGWEYWKRFHRNVWQCTTTGTAPTPYLAGFHGRAYLAVLPGMSRGSRRSYSSRPRAGDS